MVLPKEQGIQAPQERSPEWGSCSRKRNPQNIWHWRSVGHIFKRTTGLWVVETPLLKVIKHCTLWHLGSVIWKKPWTYPPADLCRGSQWGRRQWKLSLGTCMQQQPCWGAPSTTRTLTLIRAILKSFLKVISGRTQFHPPAPWNHGRQDLTISWTETQPLLPACPQKFNWPQRKDRCSPHEQHHQNIQLS